VGRLSLRWAWSPGFSGGRVGGWAGQPGAGIADADADEQGTDREAGHRGGGLDDLAAMAGPGVDRTARGRPQTHGLRPEEPVLDLRTCAGVRKEGDPVRADVGVALEASSARTSRKATVPR
jgi:hypothetical protein